MLESGRSITIGVDNSLANQGPIVEADGARALGAKRGSGSAQILAFGRRLRIHSTNFAGASIVERRLCRTRAHSSNLPDCLISASVTGSSNFSVKARSTTADLGF